MISILAQERLLGAALGSIFTGIVVFEQRRCIYNSISGTKSQSVTQSQAYPIDHNNQIMRIWEDQIREPIFGSKSRAEFAHLWNKAVDQTFRPVIESLSSSGW
ncbi:hypothetical protein PRUPE_6G101400 [Prunus persica]|uniref:PREDICTED: LOC110631685 isoform n=2 Tax=Prunus TaxID=3754 RepID=A0A5E4F791_PRUDU|nr:hypothetical protein L3X38_031377 [Prunus dulcis]ONI00700.1 hypothetical protein PRUPE_6G101400 [Prunus persica]VVA23766.1 PREDICTED: LOC110631685 isoform [Prunus dulcis]